MPRSRSRSPKGRACSRSRSRSRENDRKERKRLRQKAKRQALAKLRPTKSDDVSNTRPGHSNRRAACRQCGVVVFHSQMDDHMTRKHYYCPDCQSWYPDQAAHSLKERNQICRQCQTSVCDVGKHLKKCHFHCATCSRWFPDAKQHEAINTCTLCQVVVCNVKDHKQSSHHFCTDCKKWFDRADSHPPRVKCSVCTLTVCDMDAHVRLHPMCRAPVAPVADRVTYTLPDGKYRAKPPFVTVKCATCIAGIKGHGCTCRTYPFGHNKP